MKKQTSLLTLSLLLATPALAGGGGAPVARPAGACQTITQIVSSDPQFSTLLTAVQAAGLADTLASGEYTVFAPTNAAFAKLPSDQLAAVLNDEEMLRSVLLYHVVPGKVTARQVMSLQSAKTVQGENVSVSMMGSRVMINNASVTRADVAACNGVIHVIDTVLMPPMMMVAPAPVVEAPAPEAPAPEAPAAEAPAPEAPAAEEAAAPAEPAAPVVTAPPAINLANIPATPLSGATTPAPAETAPAPATDPATTTPEAAPADTATTPEAAPADAAATTETTTAVEANTLYDVIVADERFSTLLDLLSDAGLTETLTTGEFTVFAPTNEAFAAVPAETLANLAANPDVLRQVLSYHVVQGRLTAEQLASGTTLNSVQGGALPLSLNGSTQLVGEATVSEAVTTASNGTIFVINQVLLPPGLTIPAAEVVEEAPATTDATTSTTTTTETPAAPAATTPAPAAPATAPAATTPSATVNTNLATLIASDARFSTLAGLLQSAGLTETLTTGEFTIFAPTNEAFAKVAPADLTALGADAARLRAVLLYHVVPGRITATALSSSPTLTSVETGALTLTPMTGPDRIMIGTPTVSATIAAGEPVTAGNGVLYVIDTVLTPPAR